MRGEVQKGGEGGQIRGGRVFVLHETIFLIMSKVDLRPHYESISCRDDGDASTSRCFGTRSAVF